MAASAKTQINGKKLEKVIEDWFQSAWDTAVKESAINRPDEVLWFRALHSLVQGGLETDLAARTPNLIPIVESTVVHGGTPFAVKPLEPPPWKKGETAEVGDILFVVSLFERDAVVRREALLIQVKIDDYKVKEDSTDRELALYATWPPFWWNNSKMQRLLPRRGLRFAGGLAFPAAIFGVVPSDCSKPFLAHDAEYQNGRGRLIGDRPLTREIANVLTLNLGYDAARSCHVCYCWSQIVEDMLTYARHESSSSNIYRKIYAEHIDAIRLSPVIARVLQQRRLGVAGSPLKPWSPLRVRGTEPLGDGVFIGSDDGGLDGTLVVDVSYVDPPTFESAYGFIEEFRLD